MAERPSVPLGGVGYDPRFPTTEQTKHCWLYYVQYQRHHCPTKAKDSACQRFEAAYKQLCPYEWTEQWDQQVADGKFPGQEMWRGVPTEDKHGHGKH